MTNFTNLGSFAVTLNEIYNELVEAGFTESQALSIIGSIILANYATEGFRHNEE